MQHSIQITLYGTTNLLPTAPLRLWFIRQLVYYPSYFWSQVWIDILHGIRISEASLPNECHHTLSAFPNLVIFTIFLSVLLAAYSRPGFSIGACPFPSSLIG